MTENTLSPMHTQWQRIYQQLSHLGIVGEHSYFTAGHPVPTGDSVELHPLHRWGLIAVEGIDASAFLQGQLTANIESLTAGDSTLAAHCDAKGRMHANFVLHCRDKNHFVLQLPLSNIDHAIASLGKYAVFSKVEIKNLSEDYFGFGASAQGETYYRVIDTKKVFCVTIKDKLLSYWIAKSDVDDFVEAVLSSENTGFSASIDWETQLIDAGIGFIEQQTTGLFIPQMLNMDLLDGISFNKGCYTGQEIIARMKYRGEVKRRCFHISAGIDKLLGEQLKQKISAENSYSGPGAKIYSDRDTIAGEMISSCITADGMITGLAVIKTSFAENGAELFLAADDTGADISRRLPFKPKPTPQLYAINNK